MRRQKVSTNSLPCGSNTPHVRAISFCCWSAEAPGRAFSLKQQRCPRCGQQETLNRHSILYGNDPAKNDGSLLTRGQRVFCSNRDRRGGCGRTFSIFLADVLPRHTLSATLLGKLLIGLLANACIKTAVQHLRLPFPLETIYHLLQRLRRGLSELRRQLCRRQRTPTSCCSDPLGQTVEHLQSVFPESLCLVGDFQLSFQQPFLG